MIDLEGFTMKFAKQRLKNHFAQMKGVKHFAQPRCLGRRLKIIEDCVLNDRFVQTMLLRGKMSKLVRLATEEDLEKINEKETSLLPSNPDGLEHVIPKQLLKLEGRELSEALKTNFSNHVGLGGTYMGWDEEKEIWRRSGKACRRSGGPTQQGLLGRGREHHKIARNIVKEVSKLNLEHTFQMRYPPKDLRGHLVVTLRKKVDPFKADDIIHKFQGHWEDITLFHGIVSDINNPKVLEQLLCLFPFSDSVMRMLSGFSNCESDKLMQEMLNFVCYSEEIFLGCIGPQDTVSVSKGFEKYLGIHRISKGLHDLKWSSMLKKLKDYKQENGHCNVPRSKGKLGKWVELGQWVENQRFRAGKLSKERIDALNEIGFVWVPLEDAWRLRFEELEAYKKENGHCNVPQRSEGKLGKLGEWVKTQRKAYNTQNNRRNLSKEKIDALEDIGFKWKLR